MIRRPPRSTLFPYTTALPISECCGWASVQLDGGIEKVTRRVADWFTAELEAADELRYEIVGLEHLRLGLMAAGPVPDEAAQSLAKLTRLVVGAGGTVVVPETA